MFLTPPETEQSFKATIDELIRNCLNNNRKLIPEQLPERLSVGIAAWLIESIKRETTDLDKTAIKAADRLHSNISKMYYTGVHGIEKADIVHDFEGKGYQDFIITRETLIKYINTQPFYSSVLITTPPVDKSKDPTHQTYIQVVQNNIDLTQSQTEISNIDARIFSTDISYTETLAKSSCAQSAKLKSSRKDILSEALSRKIIPQLEKEGHKITTDIDFAKLCWNKLDDALKEIGCTNVEVAKLGSVSDQDSLEFHAKHETLMIPSKNFKAFRQRIVRMAEKKQ